MSSILSVLVWTPNYYPTTSHAWHYDDVTTTAYVSPIVSNEFTTKFNVSVCRLVKTVSRAGPQNIIAVHCMLWRGGNRSTMKYLLTCQQYNGCNAHAGQQWSSKIHFLKFLLNIYGVPFTQFWFQIKFTPKTGELFILWHFYEKYEQYIPGRVPVTKSKLRLN